MVGEKRRGLSRRVCPKKSGINSKKLSLVTYHTEKKVRYNIYYSLVGGGGGVKKEGDTQSMDVLKS